MITIPLRTYSTLNERTRGLKRVNPWSEIELQMLREAYAPDKPASDVNLTGLAASMGRHKTNVCRKARELGLTNQRRPMVAAEARKVKLPKFETLEQLRAHQSVIRKAWFADNPHPRGALGMRHSAATKSAIAQKSRERWASMTEDQRGDLIHKRIMVKRASGKPIPNLRGKWKAGWREIGGQRCFFRSRWEANYARYLEWLKSIGQIASWEHEPHTFWFDGIKRGCVSYLPDFRVTELSGSIRWHEVKGWMDDRSHTVLKRMAKYHPDEVIVLIRQGQYTEIKNKVSSLIAGWETE